MLKYRYDPKVMAVTFVSIKHFQTIVQGPEQQTLLFFFFRRIQHRICTTYFYCGSLWLEVGIHTCSLAVVSKEWGFPFQRMGIALELAFCLLQKHQQECECIIRNGDTNSYQPWLTGQQLCRQTCIVYIIQINNNPQNETDFRLLCLHTHSFQEYVWSAARAKPRVGLLEARSLVMATSKLIIATQYADSVIRGACLRVRELSVHASHAHNRTKRHSPVWGLSTGV